MKKNKIHLVEKLSEVSQKLNVKIVTYKKNEKRDQKERPI